jgi:hypothetical protein
LRTYVPSDPDKRLSREELLDCPLTDLGLIRRSGNPNSYAFSRGRHDSLPDAIFAFCTLVFWNRQPAGSDTLRFDEVAYGGGSPGQVFKLSENALVDRLHNLGALTGNKIRYDDTSGLRQVIRERSIDPVTLLNKYYGMTIHEGRHAAR